MINAFCKCIIDQDAKRYQCKCNSQLATKILVSSDNDIVKIENPKSLPSIVLLFPVIRQDSTILETFNEVLRIVQNSDIQALVVIDKTLGSIAHEFFMSRATDLNVDLYILLRKKSEAIFESQKYIRLDAFQWIIQLHDDDEWEGRIGIPVTAKDNQVFLNDFSVKDQEKVRVPLPSLMPPARIVFSLIPSPIWNRFSDFIFAQGGKVAGSADSVLNTITQICCDFHKLSDFKYIYSTNNWDKNGTSIGHLRNLAFQDGWGDLASVDIAVLNRNLDQIAAISFFKDFIPKILVEEMIGKLLSSFSVSTKRKLYLLTNAWVIKLDKHQNRMQARKLLSVMQVSWKIKSLSDASEFLDFLSDQIDLKSLSVRVEFWRKEIRSLE